MSPSLPIEVDGVRAKATLFASSFTGLPTLTPIGDKNPGFKSTFPPQSLSNTWTGLVSSTGQATAPTGIALDAVYDQIKQGSWIAIDRPSNPPSTDSQGNPIRIVTYHQVQAIQTQSMDTTTGFAAKVTVLTVNPQWLADSNSLSDDLTPPPRAPGYSGVRPG